jgi:hypothetical protein
MPRSRASRHMPAPRAARTDPTLYEWDRLTPEQQQAVLDTIGSAQGSGRRSLRRSLMLAGVVIVLLLALVVVFWLLRGH